MEKLIAEKVTACLEIMDNVAARFNDVTHYRYEDILDFLELHYIQTG